MRAIHIAILITLLLSIVVAPRFIVGDRFIVGPGSAYAAPVQAVQGYDPYHAPFMYRPYYGKQTILDRTVSYVDHDKPWYVNDGVFVRYDGKRWTGVSIGSCSGGVNCYDGHNGYDLNLWYEPVLSVAAGTVIRAGWYNPENHLSALGLWAAVDHGNGYATACGHLSALLVGVGDHVGTQWQLGTSGTSGSSTGPHLHMATYYLPKWSATDPFGWTGDYPDPNVVPDHLLWVKDPGTSNTIPVLSGNGSAIYPGATLVDDGDAGWSHTGSWHRASSSSDINGHLHWAATTSGAATATARWQVNLPADGYYEVGAFVDDTHASSGWAPYTVYSIDPADQKTQVHHTVYVDEEHIGSFQGPYGWENTGPQWISLGTYYFTASMAARVTLSNATGEDGLQVAADGVEFAPISAQSTPVYSFSVTSDDTPATMLPSSTTTVHLTLENTSSFSWDASGSRAVQVVYRWLDAQNHVIATGSAVGLPQDVAVNASVELAVPVQTPMATGSYTLQWDLLQGSTAFSQQGASVHNDTVNITLPPG